METRPPNEQVVEQVVGQVIEQVFEQSNEQFSSEPQVILSNNIRLQPITYILTFIYQVTEPEYITLDGSEIDENAVGSSYYA